MPLTAALTPPGTSVISGGVSESSIGGCPGGAASWNLNGSNCVLVAAVPSAQTAILTNWSVAIPSGFEITRIKIRVKGSAPAGTLRAQLYHSGGVVGDQKVFTPLTVPYDHTFDFQVNAPGAGWNVTGITEAIVEGSGFGVKLTWDSGAIDAIDGASLQIEYAEVYLGSGIRTQRFWRISRILSTGFWRRSQTRTTGFWRASEIKTKKG